jgi:hypothetical protein
VEPAPLIVPEPLPLEPDELEELEPPDGAGALELFELDPHAAITIAATIAIATAPRLRLLTGSSP